MELINKAYAWEEINDLERDIMEAIEDSGLPGEFTGTIRVIMTYEEGKAS